MYESKEYKMVSYSTVYNSQALACLYDTIRGQQSIRIMKNNWKKIIYMYYLDIIDTPCSM